MKLLTTPEAAIYLKNGISTLQRWRRHGLGPPYEGHGPHRQALYPQDGLDDWSAAIADGLSIAEATQLCAWLAEQRPQPMFHDNHRVRWVRDDGVVMIGPFSVLKAEAEARGVLVPGVPPAPREQPPREPTFEVHDLPNGGELLDADYHQIRLDQLTGDQQRTLVAWTDADGRKR